MKELVLLHGALGASNQLDPLAEALRPHLRVYQLDFEGHGTTPAQSRPFRMQHFAENLLELLDTRSIEHAHLFGYSMGGYVAVHFAIEHPDRVGSIATLGTKYRWSPDTATRESARLDPETIRTKVPRFAETLETRHARAGGWEGVISRTADLLTHLGHHPLLTDDTLPVVSAPVRVIVGDRDNTVSVAESSDVAGRLATGSLTVLADTPHPIEQVSVTTLSHLLLGYFLEDQPRVTRAS